MRNYLLTVVFLIYSLGICQTEESISNLDFLDTQVEIITNDINNINTETLDDNNINLINKLPEKVYKLKFESVEFFRKINSKHMSVVDELISDTLRLSEEISNLKLSLSLVDADRRDRIFNIIKEIKGDLTTENNQILELRADNEKLEKSELELKTKVSVYNYEKESLNNKLEEANDKIEQYEKKLKKYNTAFKFGISVGFNFYTNNELDYTVKSDSTLRESGNSNGISIVLSAVSAFRLKNGNHIIFNLPLSDFVANPEKSIGLFNKRIAGGLGYGFNLAKDKNSLASFVVILNVSPYNDLNYNDLKNRKFEDLKEFDRLDPKNYGSSTNYTYSLTFGFSYFIPAK